MPRPRAHPAGKDTTMTTGHQMGRETWQFQPRHVIAMMFGAAAVLFAAAVSSMAPAQEPLPAARNVAMPATETRAREAAMPVQSLGYVVFDWSDADATIPGFGPLTSDGQ
jgi:hypothetical protein